MCLHPSLRAKQTKLLTGESDEDDGTFGLRTGKGDHAGRLHHRADARSAVDTAGRHVKRIQVTAHDHALIRIFATLDCSHHVVVFDRTQLEVVADVELQLEGAAFSDHLLDDVELMLVELNIGHLGQVVEVGLRIVHHLAVVERADGHCGRLDEAQGTRLDHLLVIQSRELLIRKHLVLLAVHVVAAAQLLVLLGDLSVLFLDLRTDRVASR